MRVTHAGKYGADGARAPAVVSGGSGSEVKTRREMDGYDGPKIRVNIVFKRWKIGDLTVFLNDESLDPATLLDGAEQLALSWFGGKAPPKLAHMGVVKALYLLRTGDFCSVISGVAERIRRHDFPTWLPAQGCPWELTKEQTGRIVELHDVILEENRSMVL